MSFHYASIDSVESLAIDAAVELLQRSRMLHWDAACGGQHLSYERFRIMNGRAAQNASVSGQI